MNPTVTYQILNSIVEALKPLGVKTYLFNRPNKVAEKLDKFIVIDILSDLQRTTVGYDDYQYSTLGGIYALCRAQSDGTPNIDRQTSFVRSIYELFPIHDSIVECVNPSVRFLGLDETNFQVTFIPFTLRTKVNAFEQEESD